MTSKVKSLFKNIKWLLRPAGLHRQIDEMSTSLGDLHKCLDELQLRYAEQQERLRELQESTRLLMRWHRSQAWVYGHHMRLDPDDTVVSLHLCTKGSFEVFETELALKEVNLGDVVIDVGANIGYYTLLFARRVGPEGRVFAFEPDPHNFELLRQNVQQNGYTNVTCIPCAVSDRSGNLQLFRNDGNRGDHRVYDSSDGRSSIDVASVALDDYFRDATHQINFIKMDIQGGEAHALRGMRHLLERSSGVRLMSEFWPRGLMLCGDDGRRYLEDLRSLGFDVFVIDSATRQILPADPDSLLMRFPVEPDHDMGFTNLFCRRTA